MATNIISNSSYFQETQPIGRDRIPSLPNSQRSKTIIHLFIMIWTMRTSMSYLREDQDQLFLLCQKTLISDVKNVLFRLKLFYDASKIENDAKEIASSSRLGSCINIHHLLGVKFSTL